MAPRRGPLSRLETSLIKALTACVVEVSSMLATDPTTLSRHLVGYIAERFPADQELLEVMQEIHRRFHERN